MARAYYNELDSLKAEVLREAIRAGAIAPGDVDERSMTFGKLTIIEEFAGSKDHHRVVLCRCDCGNTRLVRKTKLNRKLVAECAKCSAETARQLGKMSRRKFSAEVLRIRESFSVYRGNARKKGIPFRLTLQEFSRIVQFSCAYCGSSPNDGMVNGLDRISSQIGYEILNVTACCTLCNFAKRDMGLGDFLKLVEKIYKHRFLK